MDLVEAGKKLLEGFKELRSKEQAKWIEDHERQLIVQPMVYFNLCMVDEFDHNFWEFLCLIKEKKNCHGFNPYDTWFFWDKEKQLLMSASAPYKFLPFCINLLKEDKRWIMKDTFEVQTHIIDGHTEEGKTIANFIETASDEELVEAWNIILRDEKIW